MKITIETPYIKLDQLLKLANLVSSGGEAKIMISEGLVKLNGETVTQRGKKIHPGDRLTFGDEILEIIGKG